ncbi:hypothetical protein EXE53_26780 [Halorubrum sp. SD626R]|uniref:DUF7847 domain-containing protein n=1 Tax=Halorubrum TaxID=56688 RepID=UPI0010F9EA3F|nr:MULTISPECIES: hypothetical protein [Halorubrum]TKX77402.1 hypothetical protein EXE53_26780 [Halorubrum sp. SD626R]
MAALQSLRPAVGGIVRNPILVVVAALFAVAQLPNLLVPPSMPVLSLAVSIGMFGVFVLGLPFAQGGFLGMADEAVSGRTRLGTFLSVGKEHYVSLLLGYLVLLALNFAFGFLAFFGAMAVVLGGAYTAAGSGAAGNAMSTSTGASAGGAATGTGGFGADPTVLAAAALVGLGLLLVYLLVTFFIQFYAHAVVLDGTDLVAGFRRSAGLVRRNLLSSLGYTIVLFVGGIVFGGIAALSSAIAAVAFGGGMADGSPAAELLPALSPAVAVVGLVVYLVVVGVMGAFYGTYSVAFYRSLSGSA